MAEFVAGWAKIFQSKEIRAFELSERQRHLVSSMYLILAAVHLVGCSQFPRRLSA